MLKEKIGKVILIFSTQRSGSTMVTSDFTQTQVLGNPSEYFTENILPGSKFNNCSLSTEEIQKEINNILDKAKTSNNVISIKIMSDYIVEIAKAIEKIRFQINSNYLAIKLNNREQKVNLQNLFIEFFNNLDVDGQFIAFRVYRKNKVKQAISRFVAARTGLYHVWKDDKGKLVNHYDRPASKATPFSLDLEKYYNYDKVSSIIDSIYKEERELDILFENFKISPINLIYEDIVEDTSYLNTIINKIKFLDNKNTIKDIKRKTVKTASVINKDLRKRFDHDGGYNGKIDRILLQQNNLLKHFVSLPNNSVFFWDKGIIDMKIDLPYLKSTDNNFLIIGGVLISRNKIDKISIFDSNMGNYYQADMNLKSEYFGTLYWGVDGSKYARFRCLIPLNQCVLNNKEYYKLDLNYSVDKSPSIKFAHIDISNFITCNSTSLLNSN